jgi:hypothetical protein
VRDLGPIDLLEGSELKLPASAGDMEKLAVLKHDEAARTDRFGTDRTGRVGRWIVLRGQAGFVAVAIEPERTRSATGRSHGVVQSVPPYLRSKYVLPTPAAGPKMLKPVPIASSSPLHPSNDPVPPIKVNVDTLATVPIG